MREATVVMGRCRRNGKGFGMRMERISASEWSCTWAFPISDRSASNEGYDKTKVFGAVFFDDHYPGCPHYGTGGWFTCPKCGKLTCWGEEDQHVTCQWCGYSCGVKQG